MIAIRAHVCAGFQVALIIPYHLTSCRRKTTYVCCTAGQVDAVPNDDGDHFCSKKQFEVHHRNGKAIVVDLSLNGTFMFDDKGVAAQANFKTIAQERKWVAEQHPNPRLAKGKERILINGDVLFFRLSHTLSDLTQFVFSMGAGEHSDTSDGENSPKVSVPSGMNATGVRQYSDEDDDEDDWAPLPNLFGNEAQRTPQRADKTQGEASARSVHTMSPAGGCAQSTPSSHHKQAQATSERSEDAAFSPAASSMSSTKAGKQRATPSEGKGKPKNKSQLPSSNYKPLTLVASTSPTKPAALVQAVADVDEEGERSSSRKRMRDVESPSMDREGRRSEKSEKKQKDRATGTGQLAPPTKLVRIAQNDSSSLGAVATSVDGRGARGEGGEGGAGSKPQAAHDKAAKEQENAVKDRNRQREKEQASRGKEREQRQSEKDDEKEEQGKRVREREQEDRRTKERARDDRERAREREQLQTLQQKLISTESELAKSKREAGSELKSTSAFQAELLKKKERLETDLEISVAAQTRLRDSEKCLTEKVEELKLETLKLKKDAATARSAGAQVKELERQLALFKAEAATQQMQRHEHEKDRQALNARVLSAEQTAKDSTSKLDAAEGCVLPLFPLSHALTNNKSCLARVL